MKGLWQRLKHSVNPEINRADIYTLLRSLDPGNPYKVRLEALASLIDWVRLPFKNEDGRSIRFKFLMQFVERNPQEAHFLALTLQEFFARGQAIRLFCLTGVSENIHFFSELRDRMILKVLPHGHSEDDLADVFKLVFTEEDDADWIETHCELIIDPFLEFIQIHKIETHQLMADITDAIIILTARIAAIGTGREIRRRSNQINLASSPFIRLAEEAFRNKESDEIILHEISCCRLDLEAIKQGLESSGVSVDLIYQMEKITAMLNRLELLVYLRSSNESKSRMVGHFIGLLIRSEIQRSGIKDFLEENLQMITKKIVERAGDKGDHYISNTPEEKTALLKAGAWAGVLTSFTALLKGLIGSVGLPYMVEGFLFFLNYALGFLLMQYWHLALSSKLPAFTASALSKKFDDFLRTKEFGDIVSEVRKISSSQFLAALGNLIWVAPVCVIIDWAWYWMSGTHIYNSTEALKVIEKHGLLTSGTMFYAFLTGILLWLSSVMAGATENWLVFRRIPTLLRESLVLNRFMGSVKTKALAEAFPAIMGGVVGNLSIAFFLSAPIVIGNITGLPLDIRHVTLGTGTLTFAFNALEWDLAHWPLMLSMAFSILVMGMLNFGVSFMCALKMAAIAKGVEDKHLSLIFRFALFGRRSKP